MYKRAIYMKQNSQNNPTDIIRQMIFGPLLSTSLFYIFFIFYFKDQETFCTKHMLFASHLVVLYPA